LTPSHASNTGPDFQPFGFIELGRDRAGDPTVLAHFEWLAEQYAQEERMEGRAGHLDQAALAKLLSLSVVNVREALATAEEVRAVIVRPLSTVSLEPEASPTLGSDNPPS